MKASLVGWWRQWHHGELAGRLFLRQRRERDTTGGVNRDGKKLR